MSKFMVVIEIVGVIVHLLILVAGIWFILTNFDLLVHDPAYTMGVIIFYWLITKSPRNDIVDEWHSVKYKHMNKKEKRLIEYLDGIINANDEKSDWQKFMEALTQSFLDNPPEPYSCICGGELELFGNRACGYLECIECKNVVRNK